MNDQPDIVGAHAAAGGASGGAASPPPLPAGAARQDGPGDSVPDRPVGIHGRRVLWPVAIAAASIVLGARGALQGTFGLIGALVRLVGEFDINHIHRLDAMSVMALLFGFLDLALPILLLVGGLLLWHQSRRAVRLHWIYAVIDVLRIVVLAIMQGVHWTSSYSPGGLWAFWHLWRATVLAVYPVFLLVWFSRAKVRAEIRLWR